MTSPPIVSNQAPAVQVEPSPEWAPTDYPNAESQSMWSQLHSIWYKSHPPLHDSWMQVLHWQPSTALILALYPLKGKPIDLDLYIFGSKHYQKYIGQGQ